MTELRVSRYITYLLQYTRNNPQHNLYAELITAQSRILNGDNFNTVRQRCEDIAASIDNVNRRNNPYTYVRLNRA